MAASQPKIVQGAQFQKVQPKLRLLANGSSAVNAVRSEVVACVSVQRAGLLDALPRGALAQQQLAVDFTDLPKAARKKPKLRQPSSDVAASVFVQLRQGTMPPAALPGETIRRRGMVTAEIPLAKLEEVAVLDNVVYLEAGQTLAAPAPIKLSTATTSPGGSVRQVKHSALHHHGAGVLVGIIDVAGFDFSHPDFLDKDGATRFVRIWDQGGKARPSPKLEGCHYGAEFHKSHLDAALRAAPGLGVQPTDLEPQSQRVEGSHGTHVASIAAGNAGVARGATLASVLVTLSAEDMQDRRRSFYDSTRVAHAVEYLIALGEELKMPVSINISLGTNGHAHDGSSAISRWIDSALASPGKAVCIAAGNAGQDRPSAAGDMGFILGRIHTSGRLAAAGLSHDVEWVVVGNPVADVSENELEVWYGAQDRFSVSLRPPDGDWIGPVAPGEFVENHKLTDGTVISLYNEIYNPANGANCLSIYLSPFYSPSGVVGVKAGTWTVRLHGDEVRDGRFQGWIERDDPQRLRDGPNQQYWRFPSFFSERSNVDDTSISSLATGHNVIAVANLDQTAERINASSSQGPTRDGREKPDVAAPGTDIIAANGFADVDARWVGMTGTSMASPFVCGVAALMLRTQPKLTAAQILGIIRRTSRPLPGMSYAWRNDAGFGVIDPDACIKEAADILKRTDLKP